MSYDLQVWSVRPFPPDAFDQGELWQQEFRAWTHARKNWQIVVSESDRVELEDIPEEISALLPGIEWLTNLNLEGIAPSEAQRLIRTAANQIARFSYGAVLDQQTGSIQLPSGVKRFVSPRSKESFDVVSMSWWFLDSPIEGRDGREQFVNLLERMLPECLPRRYGSYEPPQNVYAETGKKHFLDFLNENSHRTTVWYPRRPVVSVSLHLPSPRGAHKLGFRTNHLRIEVEKHALSEPGWDSTLKQFWRKVSALIRPIYGDVRVLGNYKWMGATVSPGQMHPVVSWWWAGIPDNLGNAVVLGDVYQKLWPTFTRAATTIDGSAFAALEDWAMNGDLVEIVGRPPQEQVQPSDEFGNKGTFTAKEFRKYLSVQIQRRQYPTGWPFGQPFAE
jgi:hypothetical protein